MNDSPGGSDNKVSAYNSRDPGFNPWVGKIWRRKWQPTPVFLPRKFHGQRSLVGYIVRGVEKSQTRRVTSLSLSNRIMNTHEPIIEPKSLQR